MLPLEMTKINPDAVTTPLLSELKTIVSKLAANGSFVFVNIINTKGSHGNYDAMTIVDKPPELSTAEINLLTCTTALALSSSWSRKVLEQTQAHRDPINFADALGRIDPVGQTNEHRDEAEDKWEDDEDSEMDDYDSELEYDWDDDEDDSELDDDDDDDDDDEDDYEPCVNEAPKPEYQSLLRRFINRFKQKK